MVEISEHFISFLVITLLQSKLERNELRNGDDNRVPHPRFPGEEIKRRLPEDGRLMSSGKSIGYLLERNRITVRHSIKTRRAGER